MKIDLTGQRFGRLTVQERAENRGERSYWVCGCDCGSIKTVRGSHLLQGLINSCRCIQKEQLDLVNRTHSMAGTVPYRTWRHMKSRCLNPKVSGYENYGGRGIQICGAWEESFENFWSDMGPSYVKGLSIGRIDNEGDYSPENCRWETTKQQTRNTRSNVYVTTSLGTMLMVELAELTGIPYQRIAARVSYGWTGDRLLEPVKETVKT